MKTKPILFYAISLSILVEFILIIIVYNAVGAEKLPKQIIRLVIQFLLIAFIFEKKSNIALLALTGYHLFSALVNFTYFDSGLPNKIFFVYHLVIGLIIYFHDTLEKLIAKKE